MSACRAIYVRQGIVRSYHRKHDIRQNVQRALKTLNSAMPWIKLLVTIQQQLLHIETCVKILKRQYIKCSTCASQ